MGAVISRRRNILSDTFTWLLTVFAVFGLILVLLGCENNKLKNFIVTATEEFNLGGIIYVKNDGDDGNPGTIDRPKSTIQSAIDLAYSYIQKEIVDKFEVRVAQGTYEVNSSLGTNILMKEGVSLYGGYSLDFSVRDPTIYETRILDKSVSVGVDVWNTGVVIDIGITSVTVIDGFTIQGGGGDRSVALVINSSSPTIQHNVIRGGGGNVGTYGIFVYSNASPTIQYNVISGGNGVFENRGINIYDECNPLIQYNTITGGDGGTYSSAVDVGRYSRPVIFYNTIHGGTIRGGINDEIICINVWDKSNPSILGNSIYGGNSTGMSKGIQINVDAEASVTANNIHGGAGIKTFGITSINGAVYIQNNLIFGGNASEESDGTSFLAGNWNSVLRNNTIDGGTGNISQGVFLNEDSRPKIQNNIIFISGGTTWSCCISENTNVSSHARTIDNNAIWQIGVTILYADSGCRFNFNL